MLVSFPPLTKMFQFSGYAAALCAETRNSNIEIRSFLFRISYFVLRISVQSSPWFARRGFPIRKSPDHRLLSASPKLIAATPRPSSPSQVKASTICPYLINPHAHQDNFSCSARGNPKFEFRNSKPSFRISCFVLRISLCEAQG